MRNVIESVELNGYEGRIKTKIINVLRFLQHIIMCSTSLA